MASPMTSVLSASPMLTAPTRRVPRLVSRLAQGLTTPFVPDDYLDLVAPLRSGAPLRARIEEIHPETRDAATIVLRPGADWAGHVPGQYLRLGIDVDGVRQWRAYSLTSGPRSDGRISITVKAVPDGHVSSYLVHEARPGTMVHLEQASGEFVLGSDHDRLLFVTAGSGITPVIGMLRNLFPSTADGVLRPERSRDLDVVVVHVAPSRPDSIFVRDLEALAEAGAIRLLARYDDEHGLLDVEDLETFVPDLAERRTLACGPTGLLDALADHHDRRGLELTVEQFRTTRVPAGDGGTISLGVGGATTEVEADGATTVLDAAEDAGVLMPSGCRMGVCFGCVLPMTDGAVRDLRNGTLTATTSDDPPVKVQTCISAVAGSCTIETKES